jgi:hypothetical protein
MKHDTAIAVQIAHRSRRLTIRTVSHTQNAAKATAKVMMVMPAFYPPRRGGGKIGFEK